MIVVQFDDFDKYFSKFNENFSIPQKENLLSIGNAILLSELSKNISKMSKETFRDIHRTSLNRFLIHSPWNEKSMNENRANFSFEEIQKESIQAGTPIFFSVDDTLISKSCNRKKVEGLSKHFSHVTGTYEWGHVQVSLQVKTNNLSIPLCFDLYNTNQFCEKENIEFRSKNQIAWDQVNSFSVNEGTSAYLLADSWFSGSELINNALQKGIHSIIPMKSNRKIYPRGIEMQIQEYTSKFLDTDSLNLVTVRGKQYYVSTYEGNLNNIPNALVVISYKVTDGKLSEKPMYILSTDIELSAEQVIEYYLNRWDIEVSFRYQKNSFGLKDSQMRSLTGMKKFWSIIYLVHNFVVLKVFEESKIKAITLGGYLDKLKSQSIFDMVMSICNFKDLGQSNEEIAHQFMRRLA